MRGKLWLLVGLMVMLAGANTTFGQEVGRRTEAVKIPSGVKESPKSIAALMRARGRSRDSKRDTSSVDAYFDGATYYAALHIEFDSAAACQKFNLPDVKVIVRNQKWADVFIPADDAVLAAVRSAPGEVLTEISRQGILPPPPRPVLRSETSRAPKDKIVQGGIADPADAKGKQKLTGNGVIVAIIDSGLDFTHPDFLTYDVDRLPTSRCLYFWDTSSDSHANGVGAPSKFKYPNDAPIGTVYDRQTLTDDIRSRNPRIPSWDSDGHGTACAGVAGGNGNAMRTFLGNVPKLEELVAEYQGVAPGVDLIGVRLGTGGLENAYLLNAICQWLDEVAGNRPLVVSCSFGGQFGGRDGYSVRERHLSSRFPPERKSRGILVAAGNEGDVRLHASATCGTQESPGTISWNTREDCAIDIYVQTDKVDDVQVPIGQDSNGKLVLAKIKVNPLSKHGVISLDVPAGENGLAFYSLSGTPYKVDAYFRNGEMFDCAFYPDGGQSFEYQIGSPGDAHGVLTIGSYDWNDQFAMHGGKRTMRDKVIDGRQVREEEMKIGELSFYSSPGPLRFGDVVKPDFVAPGRWYSAAAARNVTTVFDRDTSGQYTLHNGTSAATPYAAGIVALLFEAQPTLTWGEVRKVLTESVTQDPLLTGTCPNPQWGHGKLDYKAVERAVKKVRGK